MAGNRNGAACALMRNACRDHAGAIAAGRGRGVATALMDVLLKGARSARHDVVYLFTSGQQTFWAERGWIVVAAVDAAGSAAVVMSHDVP